MKNTLCAYLRRSSDKEKGYSIETQRKQAIKVQRELNLDDLKIYNEGEGISGTKQVEDRPELERLVYDVIEGKVKHLFIYNIDRLSRDSYTYELVRKHLLKYDVKLYIGNSKVVDLNNAMDELVSGILSKVAVFEGRLISKRVRDGLVRSRENRKWNGVNLPYGYKRDENGKVIIDDEEKKVYLKMIDLIQKGKSIRGVTNYLNELGIPVKSQKTISKKYLNFKGRKNKKKQNTSDMLWRDNVVRGIIKHSYHYGKRVDKYGNEFDFPKIISHEKWLDVQSILEKNKTKHRSGNKTKHNYLLKNLLYCKRDGYKFYGRIKKDERTYYCSGKRKEIRLKNQPPCPVPSPNLDRFEDFVWNNLIDTLSSSKRLREEMKLKLLGKNYEKKQNKVIEKQLKKLNKEYKETLEKIDRLNTIFIEGHVEKDDYKRRSKVLESEKSELNLEIRNSEDKLTLLGNNKYWVDWVKAFNEEIKKWKETQTFKTKRELVEKYIDKIIIDFNETDKEHITEIHFTLPIVNDDIKYNSKDDKSKGYSLVDGEFSKKFLFNSPHIKVVQHLSYYNDRW